MIIEFWYRDNGKSRAKRFLDKLDDYERQRVVDLLEVYDKPHSTYKGMVNAGKLKHLEESLHELKIRTCGCFFRFPSVSKDENLLLLLDGFKKKSNKLEKKDIDRARDLYEEYKLSQ